MQEVSQNNRGSSTTEADQMILRRLRVWIVALAATCLIVGVGVGALLAGRPAIAQNEAQIARAPEALSASFAEIARRVEPAVVNIDTVQLPPQVAAKDKDEDKSEKGGGDDKKNDKGDKKDNKKPDDGDDKDEDDGDAAPNLPPGHPLLDMLRRRAMRPIKGVGSGFIVDPKGYIITNQHVVEGASRITVKLQTGEELRGRVVGEDDETDIAIVKVEAGHDLPTVRLGNSDDVQVGDWVLAIGSPFGLDQTVTAGIVSTLQRQSPAETSSFKQFIQTDAAINRGNSGGPLVNMRGEVIGVNSQIATTTGDYNGIGFALPSRAADFVYRQIVEHGKVSRGYLGVLPGQIKAQYVQVYGLPDTKGAIVNDLVDANSPAAKAGIQPGDILVEINNQPILSSQDLINKIAVSPVNQTIQLTYLREANGKLERRTTSVTLGERPSLAGARRTERETPSSTKTKTNAPTVSKPTLGLKLSELTPQLANEKGLQGVRGLIVRDVDPGSLAEDAGFAQDMVIQRVNRTAVNTLEDFERVMGALKPGDAVVANVAFLRRDGRVSQAVVQFTYQ